MVTNIFLIRSQDVAFVAENFPGRFEEFKNAMTNITQGDAMYFSEIPYYKLAMPYYEKANTFNSQNAMLNFKLGVCYLNSNNKYKAFEFLNKASTLNPLVDAMLHYEMGRSLQINYEFDKALLHYNLYLETTVNDEKRKAAFKRISECNTAKELVKKPVNVKIENLGKTINSQYKDYIPLVSADEEILIFTSRREDTFGNEVDPIYEEYYEDIYKSEKVNNLWQNAKNLGEPINTKLHDACAGLSADGHTLFVFSDKNNGDILISKLIKGTWSKPEDAGRNINTKFHETTACLSPDGNTLYFVSDKPGGYGGRDIYKSKWDEMKREWGTAVNLGDSINTSYNEEGVFMHPDGKTLYFSSQGHINMGGQDIVYSTLVNNAWTTPINIGYPINTPDDDVFFVVSASGKHGYYASVRKEGFGDRDIYRVTFMDEEKPLSRMTVLKGIILNKQTKEPLAANIELIDLNKNEHIGNFTTDSKTGKYLISLPSGKNYGAIAYSEGYLFESDHFDIPDTSSYSEITMDIEMKPMEEGNNIILTNIFFDKGKFDLRKESVDILNRVKKLMNDIRTLKVEISGHTDNVGSEEYNLRLSQSRAQSVVEYLISIGVDKDRLSFVGYGESRPFASNDTDEGRQKNRRIEFKILAR
ncbi:MAG: OmpA family protein [Bacteroidia bacterium]